MNGAFWTYGLNAAAFLFDSSGMNPLLAVFPRMTKCSLEVILLSESLSFEMDFILILEIVNMKSLFRISVWAESSKCIDVTQESE